MAKETTILFLYDTELLKREEEDPNSAILYFYPTWVSDQQKTALCGQLMGTFICINSIFSMPKIIHLQSGKFCLIRNNRFILVSGTDRNISDWILEYRANLIYSLVNFFHKDFESLAAVYKNEALCAKLYHIFDTYIKIIFLGGNIFNNMPKFPFSKDEKSATLKAVNILESCRNIPNVLGGLILYHNKVLATQLSADTTKKILLSDPYRIKNPAEMTELNFQLPSGIKVLQVYITNKEYNDLLEISLRSQYILQYLTSKKLNKEPSQSSDPLPLKRDTSLLFTCVPEEDNQLQDNPLPSKKPERRSRPNSLNLKTFNIGSNESLTPSVVGTPMTEYKGFLQQPQVDKKGVLVERCGRFSVDRKSELLMQEGNKNTSKSLPWYTPRYQVVEPPFKRSSGLVDLSQVSTSIPVNGYQCSKSKNKLFWLPKRSIKLKRSKTIHDPLFPVFRTDGMVSSQYYFEARTSEEVIECTKTKINNTNTIPMKMGKEHRKSLTLPLKPLNVNCGDVERRFSMGVQLTPLMTKLTNLAFEELRTVHRNNRATSTYKEQENTEESKKNDLRKCILFVSGFQDVVLTLLLKQDCLEDQKTISKLWELCSHQLPKIEKHVVTYLESQSTVGAPKDPEPFSFLWLDPDWGTIKRGGLWDNPEFSSVSHLHGDFQQNDEVSEIFLRNPDSVIYGSRLGSSEVFYQEDVPLTGGLLMPNDALGLVQLKAKKRLEKDHNIVLS